MSSVMAYQHMCCAAELAERVTKILALVTAFDEVSANQTAMEDAALQFDSLLQVRASQTHSEGIVILHIIARSPLRCSQLGVPHAILCTSCLWKYIVWFQLVQ